MRQLFDFISRLFNTADFQALWKGGRWSHFHQWIYILSDLLVWSAYFALPFLIYHFIKKHNKQVNYDRIYLLFATFILLNGLVYLIDAGMFWQPMYRLNALLRLTTGVVSWVAVYYVLLVLPVAFSLKTPQAFEEETERRLKAEEEIKLKNKQLLEAERTARVGYGKWDIARRHVELSEMAYQIMNIPQGEILSYERLMEQVHPADLRFVEDSINKNLKGKTFRQFYFRIVTSQMEIKHVLVKGCITYNDYSEPTEVKGTVQDVSELRNHMQKIEQQNRRLRKIAWVQSHRMRSPVATILGIADLLNDKDPSDPMNVEIIKNIKELTKKLDAMIHEVDALTRVK